MRRVTPDTHRKLICPDYPTTDVNRQQRHFTHRNVLAHPLRMVKPCTCACSGLCLLNNPTATPVLRQCCVSAWWLRPRGAGRWCWALLPWPGARGGGARGHRVAFHKSRLWKGASGDESEQSKSLARNRKSCTGVAVLKLLLVPSMVCWGQANSGWARCLASFLTQRAATPPPRCLAVTQPSPLVSFPGSAAWHHREEDSHGTRRRATWIKLLAIPQSAICATRFGKQRLRGDEW